MRDYNYGSQRFRALSIVGTVAEGKREFNTRKGQPFVGASHDVIVNRIEGQVRTVTVLADNGKAIARLAPNARLY